MNDKKRKRVGHAINNAIFLNKQADKSRKYVIHG